VTQILPATGLKFRTLTDDELRTAYTLFRASMHDGPVSDEAWQVMVRAYDAARTYGAFAGGRMIGTAASLPSSLTVPGGQSLPMAAVTYVGVRADHRRRGALTGMMHTQLTELAEAGEVVAALHATEQVIYGRYGYGVATVTRMMKVRTSGASLRPEVPTAGEVRLLDGDEALSVLPAAYERLRHTRAGMMGRASLWWTLGYERRLKSERFLVAAHQDADGTIDGWVGYEATASADPRTGWALAALDFQAANQGVTNDLWRYLLGIDLIDEVTVYMRPLDDPLEAALVDAAAVRSELDDELWLRLVDVPAALAARTYGRAEPVVVEVVDRLLPNNSGRYRISPHGTERTTEAAALTLDVETLAMLYLGAWRASTLADIGRIEATDPAALPVADRLFATDRPAWCGTMF
jgi:predicted acetyltransferase